MILIFLSVSSGLLWAVDEEDKSKDKQTPRKEDLDEDLDKLDKELKPESPVEEDINVFEVMKEIEERMSDAAEALSQATVWRAIQAQGQAQAGLDQTLKKQQEAMKRLNKLFRRTKDDQNEAIAKVNRLIKLARDMQISSQQSQSQQPGQPQQQRPKKQPQQMQTSPKKPSQPAVKPYQAKGSSSPNSGKHSGDVTRRWGELPPKLREAILQSKNEAFLLGYMERLKRYFKILAEEK